MSNNPQHDDGSDSSSPSSKLFFSLSSYNRFRSQYPNPTMSSNNPEHGNGSSSSKPSSKLFFTLKSYNRFLLSRSRRSQSSSSVDSIPYSLRETSSSVDSTPYSWVEITYALENSQLPSSQSLGFCTKNLTIPCCSFKRCTLRKKKVVIFCCHINGLKEPDLTSRSHHPSLVKLLDASQSEDPAHIYMVYEDIPGATLRECLKNSYNRNWMWRMKVALDLAQGLEYIHSDCSMVHSMIDSSKVIVTEPRPNAFICLFGAGEFHPEVIAGTIGYMAPEILYSKKTISQKSDVFAFGVVILELISGKAAIGPVDFLVETARDEIRREGVMRFVDQRLHSSSFPVETAESLLHVALKCVEDEPDLRPEMPSVAEDIRRLFSDSKV